MGVFLKGVAVCDGCKKKKKFKVPAPDGRGTWLAQPRGWKQVPVKAETQEGNIVAIPNRIFCLVCLAKAEASKANERDVDREDG